MNFCYAGNFYQMVIIFHLLSTYIQFNYQFLHIFGASKVRNGNIWQSVSLADIIVSAFRVPGLFYLFLHSRHGKHNLPQTGNGWKISQSTKIHIRENDDNILKS